VPFADDIELVDYLFSIKGSEKIQNGISKYLLREASKNYIPNLIYTRRDKIGFETPVQKWFLPHKDEIIDLVVSQLDFMNPSYFKSNFEEILNQKPNFVVRLYSFAIWKKVFSTF
jgi:asparagine synthase (glutamine-hydrolysing)